MNYTTGNITFNFDGLSANTQYSFFYFVTVDMPIINAKHSEIRFVNLMTTSYLKIDLFGGHVVWKAVATLSLLLLLLG